VSLSLPLLIIGVFLLIVALTALLGICFYRRFKYSRASSSWKGFYSQRSDEEQEALLGRPRSTSYYDANRSRAPLVIHHDARERPISTWSTASSVGAQRGEELSNWSRRRDDIIRIYGKSGNSDLEEQPEQEEEEDQQEHGHVQDHTGVHPGRPV
jgi:hypothetical protein